MPTHIGVGFSQHIDPANAALEAAAQAKTQARHEADLVIVFSTIHYNPEQFLPSIQQVLYGAKIIGCSTAGVITPQQIGMRGIAILAINSDDTKFATACVENVLHQEMRQVGSTLARQAISGFGQHHRKAFVYFADGLLNDNAAIVKGLQEVFGTVFPIVGAGSSDDFHFQQTYQFCDNKVMTHAVTGFLMGGKLNIGLGTRHGWRPLGKPRTIDKAVGNVIQKIDGKAAATIYDEYFGKEASSLRNTKLGQMAILYPLGIFIEGEREYLLRNAIHIQSDGSIICQGEVPQGAEVHIMLSNKDHCIQSAVDAALEAQRNLAGKRPQCVIILESLARQKLLGRAMTKEIETIKEIFGPSTPTIGMYCYGEICPSQTLTEKSIIHLQNESIVILAIG